MSHLSLPVPLNAFAEQQAALESPATKLSAAKALPVDNPTVSFWQRDLNITPSPTEGCEQPLPNDVDICIIGSGITGVGAAYHLAQQFSQEQRSIKAVILEAREFCSGATGRNGGHLSANVHEGFSDREKIYGTDDAIREVALQQHNVSELLKVIRDNGKNTDLDVVAGGHLELFFTEKELEDAKADFLAAQAAGVDIQYVEWLSKEEVQAQYGASYPGVRMSGNNLWPLKTVGLLYNLAKQHSSNFSLDLYTRTPVVSISRSSDSPDSISARRWLVETPRSNINCSYILHATNAYVSHLLPHMHGPEGVIPTRGQVMAIRATPSPDVLTKMAWGGNEGFEYWFPRPMKDGEAGPLVILGGGREMVKPRYELYEVDDSVCNADIGRAMRKFLPSVFPGRYEDGKEPEIEWSGIMGFTKTGDPFVGPVTTTPLDLNQYEGQYVSAGFSGHGMPRAFACAEAVAGMISSDVLGRDWSVPEWLPKHYLTVKH